MKTKTLGDGSNSLVVSEVCLGTMTWGEQNTEAEAHAQLDAALAAGINFVDTAELYPVPAKERTYGETERIIGRWLAADPTRRSRICLASKVASVGRDYIPRLRRRDLDRVWTRDGTDSEFSSSEPARLSRDQILCACDASLKRLGTDYLDLYQLHWPDRYTNIFAERAYVRSKERDAVAIDDQVLAMKALLDAKKIRTWGLSNENAVGVATFLEACRRLDVPAPITIQNDFSIIHRKFEEDGTAEACAPRFSGMANGIGLLAYGALAGGTLSGKVKRSTESRGVATAPAESRHAKFPNFQPRYFSAASLDAAERYAVLAAKYNITPAQLALLWARSRDYIGAIIIAATTLDQLRENIAAFSLPALTKTQLIEVDAAFAASRPYYNGVGDVHVTPRDFRSPPPKRPKLT